jgi:hypothetical protein
MLLAGILHKRSKIFLPVFFESLLSPGDSLYVFRDPSDLWSQDSSYSFTVFPTCAKNDKLKNAFE